jgi:3-oxoacyl-[acyl-carrier-protein] synthase III
VPTSTVLGYGRHLPPRVVTSDELGARLGVAPAAVTECTGFAERRYAEPGLGPADLGREAALTALGMAGREPADVDLIVFATITPDLAFPGSGCFLQERLGCRTVGALDVRAQCAGFLFGLGIGDRFVRAGRAGHVLVVGGEVHSTALDFSAAGAQVTPWFGDGAGAVVLGAGERPGVLAVAMHSDPRDFDRFWCEFPASRHYPVRMEVEHFRAGRHFYRIDPPALHPQAERALVDVSREALAVAGEPEDAVAHWVMHYFDPRVARRAADALGAPQERVTATAEIAGHVAGAGVPIALAEAGAAGRVGKGDLVVCAAFGAGMCWAAAVLRI